MCRSGCPTQDHDSWGECARAANFHTNGVHQRTEYKAYDKELSDYASARMVGLQPKTTRQRDIDRAKREAGA